MSRPTLWLIAGPNGAGKTTYVSESPLADMLGDVVQLNADDRALARLQDLGYAAFADAPTDVLKSTYIWSAEEVSAELERRILDGQAVAVETVLSSDKYKSLVESVIAAQGFFGIVYIALRTPQLACQRVAGRVAVGGHDVPAEKIISRWNRSLKNLPWFAFRANRFVAFDNSDSTSPRRARKLMSGIDGKITIHDRIAIPEMAAQFDGSDSP